MGHSLDLCGQASVAFSYHDHKHENDTMQGRIKHKSRSDLYICIHCPHACRIIVVVTKAWMRLNVFGLCAVRCWCLAHLEVHATTSVAHMYHSKLDHWWVRFNIYNFEFYFNLIRIYKIANEPTWVNYQVLILNIFKIFMTGWSNWNVYMCWNGCQRYVDKLGLQILLAVYTRVLSRSSTQAFHHKLNGRNDVVSVNHNGMSTN